MCSAGLTFLQLSKLTLKQLQLIPHLKTVSQKEKHSIFWLIAAFERDWPSNFSNFNMKLMLAKL